MTELSEQSAALVEQSVADTATRLTKANKNALDFLMGAQKAMLEEIVFAGNEMLERTRTETHLLSEFRLENGRIALGQGPEDGVRGMRTASDRLSSAATAIGCSSMANG